MKFFCSCWCPRSKKAQYSVEAAVEAAEKQASHDLLDSLAIIPLGPDEITYRGLADKGGGSHARRPSIDEDRKGTAVVELVKKEGCNLGLVVSGGVDKDERPQVCQLKPGGIAHRSDVLQEGDYILAINGIRTALLRHEEIVNLLKNASDVVMLEIEYVLPDQPEGTFSVMCKRVEVTLLKDNGSFGFTLRGGIQDEIDKTRPLTITQIRRGSVADRDGSMRPGDRLLCVNGMNVSQCSLLEVLQMLKQLEQVTLLIEYDVAVMDTVQNASGPLLLEVHRVPGSDLGVTLTSTQDNGRSIITIESIKPASTADRSGALRVGDHILSIDDTNVDHMAVAEAQQLLKAGEGPLVKLEVMPAAGHKKPLSRGSSKSSLSTNGHGQTANGMGPPVARGDAFGTMETRSSTLSRGSRGPRIKHPHSGNIPLIEVTNVAGTVLATQATVCHPERAEVTVLMDQKGVGFTLTADAFSSDILTEPPFIDQVDPNGAAAKTGVIQQGDRLLSINGESLKGRSLEEVRWLLKQAGGAINLEIEFDVADSVIPNSGIFNVKLAKQGSGLGITIRARKKKKPGGEPMLISAVQKGSVAYRTGTIQAGDKLLAINNLKTDLCSLEDAAALLRETEDVVRLCIKKLEPLQEPTEPKNSVSYTVELQRHGGPLGITISGTEERLDPIFISGLAEGGLAEKTGALHVGDRILAINGTSLWGRPLSDAIRLLQTAGDVVTLKVSKLAETKTKADARSKSLDQNDNDQDGSLERLGTPIPSVDSALESWDSNDSNQAHRTSSKSGSYAYHDCNSKHGPAGTFDDLKDEIRLESEEDNDSQRSSGIPSMPSQTSSMERSNEHIHVGTLGSDDGKGKDDGIQNLPQDEILDRIETSLSSDSAGIPIKGNKEHLGHVLGSLDDLDNLDLLENMSDISENFSTSSRIVSAENQLLEVDQQLQTIFKPTPVELLRVTLYKWKESDDFGFSLSDGVYEKGVYISAIRPDSPADKSGILQTYDKILQINGLKIKELDCHDVVPLIAESGNVIELVVSRNPLALKKKKNGDCVWVKRDERSLRGHRV